MAALELAVLFQVKHAPNPKNYISEDSEEDKKVHFADLLKDAKSVAGFSASCQFQVGRNDVT